MGGGGEGKGGGGGEKTSHVELELGTADDAANFPPFVLVIALPQPPPGLLKLIQDASFSMAV